MVLGGIALSYGNALVSIPATVHMPRLKSPGAVDYQDVVFSSIALVISVGIALIVAVGLWLTVRHVAEALAAVPADARVLIFGSLYLAGAVLGANGQVPD